ncbi:MAG: aminoacyl-tRNA hydrolase [Veillonella sp.]|nr:aminoacyl-tRNA hydrolase [Veillonella sp.]
MGTEEFPRFRLGIGRPLPQWTVVDHVLAPFPEEQTEAIEKGVKNTAKAILGTLEVGLDKGMNKYNPKKRPR